MSVYGQCLLFSVEMLTGHPTSQLILIILWSQYPSVLHHTPAIPLQPGIAIPRQKWISPELSHSVPGHVGNRNKIQPLVPLYLTHVQVFRKD